MIRVKSPNGKVHVCDDEQKTDRSIFVQALCGSVLNRGCARFFSEDHAPTTCKKCQKAMGLETLK